MDNQILIKNLTNNETTLFNNYDEVFSFFGKNGQVVSEITDTLIKLDNEDTYVITEVSINEDAESLNAFRLSVTETRNKLRDAVILLEEQGIPTEESLELLKKRFKFLS